MRCKDAKGLKLVSELELDNRSSDSVRPTMPLGIQRWRGEKKTCEIGPKIKITFKKSAKKNLPCLFFWGMESIKIFPVCYWKENLMWFQCHGLIRPQRWWLLFLRNFVYGCRQHNFLCLQGTGAKVRYAGPNSKSIEWIFYFPAIKADSSHKFVQLFEEWDLPYSYFSPYLLSPNFRHETQYGLILQWIFVHIYVSPVFLPPELTQNKISKL